MNRLVLIDGHAILHRAYHALPVLTNRNGQQVNAVYGFASMLLKIQSDLKPDYLAVVFDRPEPTFRKQEYIGYQAKRKETDQELVEQIDLVHELVQSYGIKIFEKAGFEADDIIGSIAVQSTDKCKMQNAKCKIKEIIIVTGDRDLMQLVNDKVKLYMPTRGMSEGEIVDVGGVGERLGVLPDQVVDYKALVGDSSDNYPGVPGIGPKTATDLIKTFGSFNNVIGQVKTSDGEAGSQKTQKLRMRSQKQISVPSVIKNVSEIPITDTVKQKLVSGLESGELSYKLAKIVTDVPVELDLEKLKVSGLNETGLLEFFRQMGFRSLVKRLSGTEGFDGKDKKEGNAKGKITKIDKNQQSLFQEH